MKPLIEHETQTWSESYDTEDFQASTREQRTPGLPAYDEQRRELQIFGLEKRFFWSKERSFKNGEGKDMIKQVFPS